MKQYNDKYKNVFYENKNWRLYDETTTTSLDALYSETQIKLIELIEKYNFKIFYFTCKPATNYKLIINNQSIDLETEDVKNIKMLQTEDLFYIYKNRLCEVFYSFLKLDEENNYYFDFMLVVNNKFELNNIYNHKFKTFKIISVKEILYQELTFEFIQSIYEKRVITDNNCAPIHDKEYYDLNKIMYKFEDYVKNYKNNSLDFDHQEYINFNSFYFYKRFDQKKYAKNCFKLLCSQIWSIDQIFYKEENNYGYRITYKEKYDLNPSFLTNFAELINCYSIDLKNNDKKIKKEFYTYSSLSDNFVDQGILCFSFLVDYFNEKKINFDGLEVIKKYE